MPFDHHPSRTLLALTLIGAFASVTHAQTVLSRGHVDVGAAFEDNAWDLHIHDEEGGAEYAPSEAILQLGLAARTTIPADPRFSFLGSAGSLTYILPQVENPELLFLGIGAEEVEDGVFQNNEFTFSLRAFTGPGQFALYTTDGFGNPSLFMSTADGLGDGDSVRAFAGAHTDYNWAFSAPGDYALGFEARGLLAGGETVASGLVDFHFTVVPEPSTVALLTLGAAGWLAFSRKKPLWS